MADLDLEMDEQTKALYADVEKEIENEEKGIFTPKAEVPEVKEPPPEKKEEPPEKKEEAKEGTVSADLINAINSISQRLNDLDTLNYRLKQTESRVGSVINQLNNQHAAKSKEKEPTPEEMAKALESEEDLQEFKKDFRSHANAIEYWINKATADKLAGKTVDMEALNAIVDQRVAAGTGEATAKMNLTLLRFKYPKHYETVKTPEFQKWLGGQSLEMKEKYSSMNALDGIALLDAFELSRVQAKTVNDIAREREERLESAAADTRSGKTPPIKQKTEADMTDDEYRNHIAAQLWPDQK